MSNEFGPDFRAKLEASELLSDLRWAVSSAKAAVSRDQIGGIYYVLVGYDSAKDDPGASFDDLRSLLIDYVKECCAQYGIPIADVGLEADAA